MNQLYLLLFEIASQSADGVMGPPSVIPSHVDPAVWPYWVAIGGMSTAIVAMFGYIQKIQADSRKDAKENSKRIAGEFQQKDAKVLDIATKITEAVAQFVAAIEKLADKIATLIAEVRTSSDKLQGRLERVEDKLEGREPRDRRD